MKSTRPSQRLPALREKPGFIVWLLGTDKPDLVSRPQLWGVVPTLRFWNRIDTAKYQMPAFAVGIGLMWPLVKLLVPLLTPFVGHTVALLLLMPLFVSVGLLPLGLLERWIRREIAGRQA